VTTTAQELREIRIDDSDAPALIARTIEEGDLVAINYTGSVYAFIFDVRNPIALEKAQNMKNRFRRSFTIHADLDFIQMMVDWKKLNEKLSTILKDNRKVKKIFGAKYIVRIPIEPQKAELYGVPPQLLGVEPEDKDTMHIISMETGEYANIQRAVLEALKERNPDSPPLLGMSSFNNTGEGSQNDPTYSRELALANNIPLLVHPAKYISGLSYDIVSFADGNGWLILRSMDIEKSTRRLEQLLVKEGL